MALCLVGCGAEDSDSTYDETGVPPEVPAECRSRCELAAKECPVMQLEDYPDFSATRIEWGSVATCASALLFSIAGKCADHTRFLFSGTGITSEVRYFGPTGAMLGLATGTDVSGRPCNGQSYWPDPIHCETPVVTEVFCGMMFMVDTAVSLPWSVH